MPSKRPLVAARRVRLRRHLALVAPALFAAMPGMAEAAQASGQACLTRPEATGLVAYALPQVIRGSGKRCQTSLPSGSFLTANAGAMAQRYETQKAGYWPQAKQAFLKVGSAKDPGMAQMFRSMPDDSLQKLLDVAVEGIVVQAIPLNSCTTIDTAASLLAPLPPENLAGVIALAIEVGRKAAPAAAAGGSAKAPGVAGITICKD